MKDKKRPIIPTKRWKKGESCVTNPVCRKFREAAKNIKTTSLQFSAGGTSSGLTCDALMKHNAEMEGKMMELSTDPDALSIGRLSIGTSRASSCSNATFKRVIHNFSTSNDAAHKEVLSVLEAVAEKIKEKSDDDSDVKYFLTCLQLVKSEKVKEIGHVSAILYLLSMCVKRVPQPLLRETFGEASKVILETLQANVESESLSLVGSAIKILAALLRSLDHSSWKLENTRHIFFSILCLSDCDKHKVRKLAQNAVGAVLRGSCFMTRSNSPPTHPAAGDVFEFCRKKLEERPKGTDKSYLYIVSLLGDILPVFSKAHLENLCEIIIGLMTSADTIATNDCLNALRKMFAMRPRDGSLTSKFNELLISELFKHQPTVQMETMTNWLLTTGKAYSNLAKLDPATFLKKLPDFFKACFNIMSNQSVCAKPASEALMSCISECTSDVISCASEMSRVDDSPVHRLVKELMNTYSMLFMDVMATILKITNRFIEFFGKACSNTLKHILKPLHGLKCSEGFQHKATVMEIFATSVKRMGPQVFLEVLPLEITGENDNMDFPMSWILPLMRDNTRETNLKFFIDYFLPLLSNINQNLPKYDTEAKRKTYEIIADQIWSLLSGFCTSPNDLVESFPKLAKLLANMIRSDNSENSRLDILAGIRKIVVSARTEEELATVGKYARNYLPLFSSMYTGTQNISQVEKCLLSEGHNRAVLETFKVFLEVAPEAVVQSSILECMSRHQSKDLTDLQRNLLVDLILCLIKFMNINTLTDICKISKEYIEKKDFASQKKGYKLLEEICDEKTKANPEFLSQHFQEIVDFVIKSFETSNVVSKAPRLGCIKNLIKFLDVENIDFLKVIIPETIMCISIPGSKKKSFALKVLVEVAKGFIRWNPGCSAEESLKKFMVLLFAGLASSPPNAIKCTITAIAEILRDKQAVVGREVLEIVVENLISLLKSNSREVLRPALDLVKVLVFRYNNFLSLFIKPLVTSLVEMDEKQKHHFRFQTKEIYVKLVKKFGHQMLLEMMPQSSHKIINHIRKELQRDKKKKKDDSSDSEDDVVSRKTRDVGDDIDNLLLGSDDDDDEDDDDMKSSMSRKSRMAKKSSKKMVFIENEEVTDFLDPSAYKSISAKKVNKKKTTEIKMRDGKLIIEDDDENYDTKSRKGKKKSEDGDDDDFDDCVSRYTGHSAGKKSQKNKKRRRDDSDDDSDDDDDDGRSKFSYKSGGTGIHRKNPSKQPVTKRQKGDFTGKKDAKKQRGDSTKADDVQPFKYVPLDKRMLNRRFRNKFKL